MYFRQHNIKKVGGMSITLFKRKFYILAIIISDFYVLQTDYTNYAVTFSCTNVNAFEQRGMYQSFATFTHYFPYLLGIPFVSHLGLLAFVPRIANRRKFKISLYCDGSVIGPQILSKIIYFLDFLSQFMYGHSVEQEPYQMLSLQT